MVRNMEELRGYWESERLNAGDRWELERPRSLGRGKGMHCGSEQNER